MERMIDAKIKIKHLNDCIEVTKDLPEHQDQLEQYSFEIAQNESIVGAIKRSIVRELRD